MADAGIVAIAEQLLAKVEPIFNQMVMQWASAKFAEMLAPGGEVYMAIQGAAIAGAEAWYGMYSPKKYVRGMTLSMASNNPVSSGDVSASGGTLHATCHVQNTSPHAGYSYGFRMRGGAFRPGGDLMAMVPSTMSVTIDVPDSVVQDFAARAIQAVL